MPEAKQPACTSVFLQCPVGALHASGTRPRNKDMDTEDMAGTEHPGPWVSKLQSGTPIWCRSVNEPRT